MIILKDILSILSKHSDLIIAFATFFTGFVALYIGVLKDWIRRPKLIVCFKEKKEAPYFRKLSPGKFKHRAIEFRNTKIEIYKPGFCCLVKVMNNGKSTAKNVQCKIEKIEFMAETKTPFSTRYYHPSTIQWSGEKDFHGVDIVNESYYFLDIFYSINEYLEAIVDNNYNRYLGQIGREIIEDIVKQYVRYNKTVFWNVWVDQSYDRGIPKKYDWEGNVKLYYILYAENAKPVRFEAHINWAPHKWNMPDVKIKSKGKYINSETGEGYRV